MSMRFVQKLSPSAFEQDIGETHRLRSVDFVFFNVLFAANRSETMVLKNMAIDALGLNRESSST